jgi:hypothetical protein
LESPLQPIVKAALGPQWELLPQALQRNFDLQPGTNGEVILNGTMYEIWHSLYAKLFVYAGRLCGALIPWKGRDIPIRIEIRTYETDPRFMYWRRIHQFPGHPDAVFASRMEYIQGDTLVEQVHLGLGMCMCAALEGEELKFRSPCYQWKIFGKRLAIPNWLLLGTGEITERQVSPDAFEMFFEIRHPVFGTTYRYNGIFTFDNPQEAGGQAR